jgi:hypothetical protein
VCLAAQFPAVRGRLANHSRPGALVQARSAAQPPGLPESGSIPDAPINAGGLISGEHYIESIVIPDTLLTYILNEGSS